MLAPIPVLIRQPEKEYSPPPPMPSIVEAQQPTSAITLAVYEGLPHHKILASTAGPRRLLVKTSAPGETRGDFLRSVYQSLDTEWLIWMSGVAAPRLRVWLSTLIRSISESTKEIGALAPKLCHTLKFEGSDPRDWFKAAGWFTGKDFRLLSGTEAPNGDSIHYPHPGFFAIRKEAMDICKIPDTRIDGCGMEIVIGEQLHQGGYFIKSFDERQQYVRTGVPERCKYPWET
jgi:hypothetical protein